MSAAIDISPKKDNSVLKEIIKEGTGDELPCSGYTVTVHYTGTLLDGTVFDSSKERNEPFSFELGRGRVIKAWEIGVATMKKGEIAILTCAPDYAYGSAGNPPKIPPSATLKFEIEVISWQLEDLSPEKDGSILRQQMATQLHSQHSPKEGALVQIHLVGKYNDQVFEDREVKFCLGEGEEHDIIEGVEKALGHFKSSEKSKLFIKSKYAFKDKGNAEFNIPPHADVEYIVELKEFESYQEPHFLPEPEKIKQAKILKEKGTNFFKQEKYNLAIKQYCKMEKFLKHQETDPPSDEIKEEKQSLLLSSHLNLALCYLKINQHVKAKDACNEAMQIDHANVKALFRRGQAYLGLASPELAIKDFQEVLKIEPNNTAAMKKITACNSLIKEHVAKEKKLYANMFEKFARQDKQREEEKLRQQPDVMREALGEWGQEERPGGRDATAFEKENPNILMLNANGTGEFQNM